MTSCSTPGQRLARGTCRHLHSLDFRTLTEFVPTRRLRVDIMAVGTKGEIWIIECKSSLADFRADHKWMGYLDWCDRFFWAVDADFPRHQLPGDTGVILCDAFDGEILLMGARTELNAARRKKLILKFGRDSAARLSAFTDPAVSSRFSGILPAP